MQKKGLAARTASVNQPNGEPLARSGDQTMRDGTQATNEPNTPQPPTTKLQSNPDTNHTEHPPGAGVPPAGSHASTVEAPSQRQPLEYVDEVLQVLKTHFPLLILSLETMVDQIQHKFKLSPDEEIYRNVCMLLQDAIQVSSCQILLTVWTSQAPNRTIS